MEAHSRLARPESEARSERFSPLNTVKTLETRGKTQVYADPLPTFWTTERWKILVLAVLAGEDFP
jgi:hypothetical protein